MALREEFLFACCGGRLSSHSTEDQMKIGFMTDIHGNIEALSAVMAALKRESCDCVVHGGDAVGQGLYPVECLDMLQANGVVSVNGNYELLMGKFADGTREKGATNREGLGHEWTYSQLSTVHIEQLRDQPLDAEYQDNNTKVHCTHYAVDPSTSTFKAIRRDYGPVMFRELFKDVAADCVLFGHDHGGYQFNSERLYVNPGPVGYGQESWATYCTVTLADSIAYTIQRVHYDMDRYVRDLRESDFPNKEYVVLLLTMPRNISQDEAIRLMNEALED